jgi:methyl-accepting chemotaxis protein
MKNIFKQAISTAVKTVMLISIAVLLSQCSRELRETKLQHMESVNGALADNLKDTQNGYIRILRTVANIMADYENVPPNERRDRYDDMLLAVLKSESGIASLYTVWKPNALDGMDSRHIARLGSGPSGQYAVSYKNDGGQIHKQTVADTDIDTAIGYINGPNAKKDHVEEPSFARLNGRDTYLISMSIPIVNRRTNETTGIVGCLLDIDAIQKEVENILMNSYEIAAMTIYSNNGFIMGSYVPDRIGKNLIYVDTIYGEHIREAEQAVLQGMNFYCLSYSSVLRSNVAIFMTPFSIGNSDTTWSVMIAATEDYFKGRGFLNFR